MPVHLNVIILMAIFIMDKDREKTKAEQASRKLHLCLGDF